MSRRYDPEQLTHPLDVAKSAALVGSASGTYTVEYTCLYTNNIFFPSVYDNSSQVLRNT
jgi:hypothetical protein